MSLPVIQSRNAITILSNLDKLPPLSQLAFAVSVQVMTWEMRSRTRKTLSKLTHAELADVGMTPTDAHREAQRWFWQA